MRTSHVQALRQAVPAPWCSWGLGLCQALHSSVSLPTLANETHQTSAQHADSPSTPGVVPAAKSEDTKATTEAEFVAIQQETPTVKRFVLKVADAGFNFRPGQWVDLFAPGVAKKGGYSIVSTPKQLHNSQTFELAVKKSNYPPAAWMHQAKVGERVGVRVGGTFRVDDEEAGKHPLLLIAGGIGITPLYCILKHTLEVMEAQDTPKGKRQLKATLLYSASTADELALCRDLMLLEHRSNGGLRLHLHVSKHSAPETDLAVESSRVNYQRFGQKDLETAIEDLQPEGDETVIAFICGPPKMTDEMVLHLQNIGLKEDQIRFERWW